MVLPPPPKLPILPIDIPLILFVPSSFFIYFTFYSENALFYAKICSSVFFFFSSGTVNFSMIVFNRSVAPSGGFSYFFFFFPAFPGDTTYSTCFTASFYGYFSGSGVDVPEFKI